ncbi:DNA-binding protein [Micrococcaceae bacterium RIT802]|nr:DNA-binding protein [Micrococcaceae bacterium RIT 802]
MISLNNLVTEWLSLPDLADELGVSVKDVHRLLDERSIVEARIGERKIRSVPAGFVQDGRVVESLKGTISVLVDSGFSDEELIAWLFTPDESLPGTPIEALREGRKTEIRRRAQALAW